MACRKVLNVSRGDKKACPISQVWLPGYLFLWFPLQMNNLEGVSFLPTSTFMIFERSLVALAVIHE